MTATDTPPTGPPLGYYLERPVQGATLQITGTGASLDKGLAMGPVALDPGSEVDVVLRCKVTEHRHEFDEDFDAYQLVNRLKAEAATIVEAGQVASEALDQAEEVIARRKSEAERRKREESGELELPLGDGEPQTVGDVLDDVIGTAEEAEVDTAARGDRMAQLHTWDKAALLDRAGELSIRGRHDLTKAELVEQIADWETEEGTDG